MTQPTPATTAPCPSLRQPLQRRGPRPARQFCCPGCQAVAESIVAGGLEHYYQHRSDNSANPEALPKQLQDELALYDRSDVQQTFVRHAGDLAETTLLVEGISCAACGWLIEKHLRNLPGVAEARLNLSNHRLLLNWHDQQLPLSRLLAELRQIGYAAHPISPTRPPSNWPARTAAPCAAWAWPGCCGSRR